MGGCQERREEVVKVGYDQDALSTHKNKNLKTTQKISAGTLSKCGLLTVFKSTTPGQREIHNAYLLSE